MNASRFNEEQVKNKVILPLLSSLGIHAAELEFETTFQIQLGRGIFKVGSPARKASGRSDILCKRNGRPLFMIELKAESEALTDSDRRQGLSYARLLEPIAPYVLLCNGIETKVYDSVTGDEVDQTSLGPTPGLRPSIETEVSLRFEALKHFIGLSLENLIIFCRTQNETRLRSVQANSKDGPTEQLERKHIPAAYVSRLAIENSFRTFLNQNTHTVFTIVGPSGVGKSSTMCFLAESDFSEPCLFYSGTVLSSSLLEQLSLDFNLIFSAQESSIALLKKISSLTKLHDKNLTVFIDAIDEWESPTKTSELDMVVQAFRTLGLRLVVSCKTSNWNEFLVRRGEAGPIKEALFPDTPALTDFSPGELKSALKKYSRLLRINARGAVRSAAIRNPFALRIAVEVAYSSKSTLNTTAESRESLRQYLTLKLSKCVNPGACWRLIDNLAALMEKSRKVQLEETELRRNLGIDILQELPRDLFDHGILERHVNESGAAWIAFYFSTIRDYILAFRVHRLAEVSGSQRRVKLGTLYQSYVGESSVIYLFRTGSPEERKACLDAAYSIDLGQGGHHVADLIAWHGDLILRQFKRSDRNRLLEHLEKTLFDNPKDGAVAEQVLQAITKVDFDEPLEELLVSWLYQFAKTPKAAFVMTSEQIAHLLQKGKSRSQTARLVNLALDTTRDGYVRRYAIAALERRAIPSANSFFLQLIQDPDADVRLWIRGWYSELENSTLQRAMFATLRAKLLPRDQEDIVMALGGSHLHNTGEHLFNWFMERDRRSYEILGWTSRALAELNYRPAVAEFIRRLKRYPHTRLGELLLISLGEMKAKEALPDLLQLLETPNHPHLWCHWCAGAISRMLDVKKASRMTDPASRSGLAKYVLVLAHVMATSARAQAYAFSFVSDTKNNVMQRNVVLREWGQWRMGYHRQGYSMVKGKKPPPSRRFEGLLYGLLPEHSELSVRALLLLIALDPDIERLVDAIRRELPLFRKRIQRRELIFAQRDRLEEVGQVLRPWLNRQLASPSTAADLLWDCAVLAESVGDVSTWEAIQHNWSAIEAVTSRQFLNELERCLRA